MTLSLSFHLDHRYDLGMGIHQFCLWKHISVTRNILMNRVDQNQVIAGRGKVSTLEDAADLTVPDGVSLP